MRFASQVTRSPVAAQHEKGFAAACQRYTPPGLGQKEHNQSGSHCQKNPLDKGRGFVIMKTTYKSMLRLEGSLSLPRPGRHPPCVVIPASVPATKDTAVAIVLSRL